MFSHGLIAGLLFLLVGAVYERAHTREISAFGGIAKITPILAGTLVFASFASLGLPGMSGFVGEFLVLVGSLPGVHPCYAVIAAFAVMLTVGYLLWMLRRVTFGPLNEERAGMPDMTAERGALDGAAVRAHRRRRRVPADARRRDVRRASTRIGPARRTIGRALHERSFRVHLASRLAARQTAVHRKNRPLGWRLSGVRRMIESDNRWTACRSTAFGARLQDVETRAIRARGRKGRRGVAYWTGSSSRAFVVLGAAVRRRHARRLVAAQPQEALRRRSPRPTSAASSRSVRPGCSSTPATTSTRCSS